MKTYCQGQKRPATASTEKKGPDFRRQFRRSVLSRRARMLPLVLGLLFPLNSSAEDIAPNDAASDISAPPDEGRPPLWQFGFGAGGGVSPHYPASDQSSLRFLASPTFRYRGRVLRSDDEGTRARLLKFENSEVDLSGAASFPVSGSDNEARRGMRELDWIGEGGPRLVLKWRFQQAGKLRGDLLRLKFPIRAVASSNGSSLAHRGFVFQPGISWERVLNAPTSTASELSIEIDSYLSFIDSTLGNYFFGVSKLDETPQRRAYEATAGMLALSTGLTFVVSPKALADNGSAFFVSVRNSTTSWSANRGSSLHRSDQQFIFFAGFNLLWINSKDREENTPE